MFVGHEQSNKVYPDQTASQELSDQGILYLQGHIKASTGWHELIDHFLVADVDPPASPQGKANCVNIILK